MYQHSQLQICEYHLPNIVDGGTGDNLPSIHEIVCYDLTRICHQGYFGHKILIERTPGSSEVLVFRPGSKPGICNRYSFVRNAIGRYYFITSGTEVLLQKCSNGNPSSKAILSTGRYSSQPN